MERFYTKIVNTLVYEDAERPVTSVRDVIIDPETGKLIAFVVNSSKNLIITPPDVISWGEVIHIHNMEAIIKADEVLRVLEVQKGRVNIFHNKVFTKSGKYLGKVFDFVVDSSTFMLQKLYVAKGWLGLFRYDGRIISAKNILEILPNKIVIKEDLKMVKEKEPEIALEDMAVT